ncbi:hypothetical protein DFJ43DRAFT_1224563 [Lentinula guzmanii]|uniref:Uncharacterized protein n=1 Tax=Lentinula guzmanii TaxID=2804957 RepID=A0AA38JG03_9AGAR|nr:hypothetical protein DFJ43DRAFT_1224563 [Lentinula guzmanii]
MAQPARKKPRLKSALTKRINAQRVNSPSPSLSPPSPPQISSRTRTPASSSHIQISTASNSSQTNTQPQARRAQTFAHEDSQQQERRERRKKRKYEEFVKEVAAEYEAEYKLYKTLLPYQQIGLYAPRCLSLYQNMAAILNAGLARETRQMKARTRSLQVLNEELNDDDESDLDEDDLAERTHLLTIYDKIASTFPSIIERLLESVNYDDTETYNIIINVIDQAFSEARRNDTSRLKTEILRFIPNVFQTYSDALPNMNEVIVLDPPCLCDAKSDRGVNHPMITMLFCPFRKTQDALLRNNATRRETIMDSLMSHDIPLTADDLPMFLYDLHKFDSKNKWGGLLRGRLLILICRCILLGPGAAFAPRQRSARKPTSVLLGITQSSPELIAYVAVQARFALSSRSSWTRSDSKFKFDRFYLNILSILAHASDRWKESLFKFWNRECFHDIPNTAEAPANDSELASLFTESSTPEDDDSEDDDNQQGAAYRGVNEGGGDNDNGGNGNGGDSEDDGGQVNGGDGYIDEGDNFYNDGVGGDE